MSNNANNNCGGGVELDNSSTYSNLISGLVSYNSAIYGGGVNIDTANSNQITASIYCNNSYGGGIYLWSANYNKISGPVLSNSTYGIRIESGYSNIFSGQIGYNTGGGIAIYANSNLITATIISNTANNGGGIYLCGSNNIISGPIISNKGTNGGGGIFIMSGYSNVITSFITNNFANNGGGIYLTNVFPIVWPNIFSCVVSNNYSSNAVYFIGYCSGNILSNCVIAGVPGSNTYNAIYGGSNITLVSSTFVSNGFGYFWMGSGKNVTNNSDWTNINNPTWIFTTTDSTNNVKW